MKFNKIIGVCFYLWMINFAPNLKACDDEEESTKEIEKKNFLFQDFFIPSEIIGAIADYTDFEPQIDSNAPYLKEKYGHLYEFRLINSSFRQGIDQYLIDYKIIYHDLKPEIYQNFLDSVSQSLHKINPLDCLYLTTSFDIRGRWNLIDDFDKIQNILKACPHLKSIDICIKTDSKIKNIAEFREEQKLESLTFIVALKEITKLEQLTMKNFMSFNSCKLFENTLPFLQNLKTLFLSCIMDPEGIEKVCHALKFLKHLEHLRFSWNGIGDNGLKILGDSLESLPYIRYMNLSLTCTPKKIAPYFNYITNQGAIFLAEKMIFCKHLNTVNLEYNCIEEEGIKALEAAEKIILLKYQIYLKLHLSHQNFHVRHSLYKVEDLKT